MRFTKHIILFLISIILLAPFFIVIFGSTQDSGWVFRNPVEMSFGNSIFKNFRFLLEQFDVIRVLFNSFLVSFLTATTSITVLFLAAYGFNKFYFKFKRILFVIFVASVFLPQISILIGQLKVMSALGIYGSLIGLILPFVINVRTFVYLYNACFYIPMDLIEAARMDGSNEFNVIFMISLPLIKDKVILSFFMLFIASWNNFLIPMISINTNQYFTMPIMISSLSDPLSYNNGAIFLALAIYMIPIIILFVLMSKNVFENNDEAGK